MAMIRTPIYKALPNVPPTEVAADPQLVGTAAPSGTPLPEQPAREANRDDYIAKVIKYVPAEILAVFIPFSAGAAAISQTWVMIVFVICLLLTPGYFFLKSMGLEDHNRPTLYFYVLSMAAFVVWALAMSADVRVMFNVETKAAELILGLGALLIPFADELIARFAESRPVKTTRLLPQP